MVAPWGEPRPGVPPARSWRDGVLVAGLLAASVVELLLRDDRRAAALVLAVSVVVAACLPWRRSHPLTALVAAVGALLAFDVVRILAVDATGLLSVGGVLLLPHALLRWGAGREVLLGTALLLVWLPVTQVADPTSVAEGAALYGCFVSSAALGAAARYRAASRQRELEQVRLRQRNELARELHDTVGHRVSAIAVQAQAGRALSATDPARAVAVLDTIEQEASRTLQEMRALVGVLRDGAERELAPRRGLPDVERLARAGGEVLGVRVTVEQDGRDVDDVVATAVYRIAAEAVTNAVRHASGASEVVVDVVAAGDRVRLHLHDDGRPAGAGSGSSGFGLRGMVERADLLGGHVTAGPDPAGGWTVHAELPRAVGAR